MRTPLTLLVCVVVASTGLFASWVQCQNFALAGELDQLTKDSAWLDRCIGEQEVRLAELTYKAERELSEGKRDEDEARDEGMLPDA
ncbi:MAG: hypothetical protein ACI835_000071 [Planctomycetota bacterium]|jgi:hypothetical protein